MAPRPNHFGASRPFRLRPSHLLASFATGAVLCLFILHTMGPSTGGGLSVSSTAAELKVRHATLLVSLGTVGSSC